MFVLLLLLSPDVWSPQDLDPEVLETVEAMVMEADGWPLAESDVLSILEESVIDLQPELAGEPTMRKWLPVLVLRLSWAPGRSRHRSRWEIVAHLAWPIG